MNEAGNSSNVDGDATVLWLAFLVVTCFALGFGLNDLAGQIKTLKDRLLVVETQAKCPYPAALELPR